MDFKCKKCGGELLMQTRTIGVCSYCKSRQTVCLMQEKKQIDSFQRSEIFRMNSDFDQASKILESMIEEGQEDAELHWALSLCRYGIIYVEDPQTHKQLPTFYRLQKQSFLTDPDYLEALKLAGNAEREVYKAQALEISRIQQQINQYLANCEQYDVFISYKETDKNGNRTKDSEIAHQIYNALSKENIRVFFSHISLENMLGEDYEAVIYSALMSSKLMLLVMTNEENAEAAWVKNEWKRYLSLINQDDTKRLVPVLYGMKPETMPADLAHLKLQALDFTQLGAIEDLVHCIKKVLKVEKEQATATEAEINNDKNEEILRTAFFCLAEQKYNQAEWHCKDILVRDPENARGHFCCFAAQKRLPIASEQDLVGFYRQMLKKRDRSTMLEKPLGTIVEVFASYSDDFHYQQAYKYGDRNYKNLLNSIHTEIENLLISKIDENAAEATTAEDHYRIAWMYGLFPDNPSAMKKKADHVRIKDFTDAKEQYDNLMMKADRAVTFRDCMEVADMLASINYRDSASKAQELRKRGCHIGYQLAVKTTQSASSDADHLNAVKIFEELAKYGYKDSLRKLKEEQRIVFEMRTKEAKKYAEEHPTAEGYLTAADMLNSLDFDEARKDEKKYKKLAIKAAKSRSGEYNQKEIIEKNVSIFCTLFSVLLIGAWTSLLISKRFGGILEAVLKLYTNETEQFVMITLAGITFGIVYGFFAHYSRKRGFLCFLFLLAAVGLPIYYAMTGNTYFKFSDQSIWQTEEHARYVSYLFGALMVPAFIVTWFIAYAKWQSVLKTVAWIVGLFILMMLFIQVNFGEWGNTLQKYHHSLSETMQIVFFPIVCTAGALLFGFVGKKTKISRLIDFIFVAAVFSLAVYGPDFIWKTSIYQNWGISKQLFLAILLAPSLIVFLIPRESKKVKGR